MLHRRDDRDHRFADVLLEPAVPGAVVARLDLFDRLIAQVYGGHEHTVLIVVGAEQVAMVVRHTMDAGRSLAG